MDALTSDIKYVSGTVTTSDYDLFTDSFHISVDQMEHSLDIIDIRCLVWTEEDRSDGKWYITEYVEDVVPDFTISVSDFSDNASVYYIEMYTYTADSMMYQIGSTTLERK